MDRDFETNDDTNEDDDDDADDDDEWWMMMMMLEYLKFAMRSLQNYGENIILIKYQNEIHFKILNKYPCKSQT